MRQGRIVLSLLLISSVMSVLNAAERTLIDFTTYNENIAQVVEKDQQIYEQLIAENPELDIRNFGWPEFAFEASDWNLDNWKVVLNPSSDTKENRANSQIKNTPSKQYGNVLGVRLQFNPWDNSFWAYVRTPFHFSHVYMDGKFINIDENNQDNGMAVGVLANVGQIKNVRSWVYGLNYKYTYGVILVNEMGKQIEFGLGSMYHEGWRRLSWDNKDYLENPNDWFFHKNPLYPYSVPYLKFEGLAFYKPANYREKNFIGYVKDVTVDYDFALVQEERDIDDEAVWNIIANETIKSKIAMSKVIAEEIILKKQAQRLKTANDAENNNTNVDTAAAN